MLALLLAWLLSGGRAEAQVPLDPATPDGVMVLRSCVYDAPGSVYDTGCVYQ